MRSLAFAALAVFLSAGQVFAERDKNKDAKESKIEKDGPDKHMGFPEKFLEKLDERLHLTADQKKTIKAALDEAEPAIKKRREEAKEAREKMVMAMKGMKSEMRDAKEKIRATLDIDQREEFDEMMARMMMMRGRKGGMGQGMMGGRRAGDEGMGQGMGRRGKGRGEGLGGGKGMRGEGGMDGGEMDDGPGGRPMDDERGGPDDEEDDDRPRERP
jgi:hypothetical protein